MIEGILLFLAISIAIELIFWAFDTKANYFWCIFEPLTRKIWYYFSSIGEVYAAQRDNCGAFFIGGRPCLARIANARIARTIAPAWTARQRIAIAGSAITGHCPTRSSS